MNNIVLIGSGSVATHLGLALKNKNYIIKQVFSKNLKNAKKLAKKLDSKAIDKIEEMMQTDLVIISITDYAIEKIISKIKTTNIIHTSGGLDLNIFKNKFKNYGVLYPVQTFNKKITLNFYKVPLCIEANNLKFKKELKKLAKSISKSVFEITSKQRKKIHIAAVFSSNFSNHMFAISDNILQKENIKFSILMPLIKQTVKKLENNKAKDIQTGPAKRKDQEMINKHLQNIEDKEIREIYKKISHNIIKSND